MPMETLYTTRMAMGSMKVMNYRSLSIWNMTLTGPEMGLLQFAVKGHELGAFQASKISRDENEVDSKSSAK
jgi:hypothetical protein